MTHLLLKQHGSTVFGNPMTYLIDIVSEVNVENLGEGTSLREQVVIVGSVSRAREEAQKLKGWCWFILWLVQLSVANSQLVKPGMENSGAIHLEPEEVVIGGRFQSLAVRCLQDCTDMNDDRKNDKLSITKRKREDTSR